MELDIQEYSHRRYNILTGEWILVSPHRTKRPWQGQNEKISKEKRPSYDKECYLCATNTRINGEVNPDYKDVFVFTNDFAALQKDSKSFNVNEGLLKAESEQGICKVICFSPDHSKSLAEMSVNDIQSVVETWQKEYALLGGKEDINYVQIFENKGAVMGCSNPHPHGQIWAQNSIPVEIEKKSLHFSKHFEENKTELLEEYIQQELKANERIVFENKDFVVLVPFWAVWPFETMIVPKKKAKNILEMNAEMANNFAEAIQAITAAYDAVFEVSFPYSAGIHQAPTDVSNHDNWHWHMSFYPPLLRSASVKKFMVGYEMFAMPQRDITAEQVAKQLKALVK